MIWTDSMLDDLPDSLLRWLACDCAERALTRERAEGRESDERSWRAVEVARLFAAGRATQNERNAAWSAAGSAAWDAERSAERSAARNAAWSAEREWQVERLEVLKEIWQTCGERSAWLLLEGKCPMEEALGDKTCVTAVTV